jgi:hypothetical protein
VDVQDPIDGLTARLEAQEREIENLKARGRRKKTGAPAEAGASSRRELLKLGGAEAT